MSKPKATGTTKLEKAVAQWANARGADYDNGAQGAIKDLLYGGCQSGIVGQLIYYTDTLKFYHKHGDEIAHMLAEQMNDTGSSGPAAIFGDKWDNEDPLAKDTQNRNLLAWFGFEETARKIADRLGWEV